MRLYIVRHGAAVELGEGGATRDADRTLSDEGRRKTRLVAVGLQRIGCRPARVGTSPLPRAAETACILAETVCPKVEVETCDFLAPGAEACDVVEWLAERPCDEAMIVGHMPDVARIASDLLSGDPGLAIQFKKSAVCCVSFEEPAISDGALEWLMQPRPLKALGKTQG
jgi:phosphohistidine phosphatase